MDKGGFVYIMASRRNGTLYTGVTADLYRRVIQHRDGEGGAFTKRYNVKMLVWYERYEDIEAAIDRETNIKRWNRAWKLKLIEDMNPAWRDLAEDMGLDPFLPVIPAYAGT